MRPLAAISLKPLVARRTQRDESTATEAAAPDPAIVQAQRDIEAGMVDTDMRATPGLDAGLRAQLVRGGGGKPPPAGA
jgi:hypothetical protein